jgi:hypothetical protein
VTTWGLVNDRLEEFGVKADKHVVSIVTDGAAVMKKVGEICPCEQQLCLVHGLHLAVTDVLYSKKENDEELGEVAIHISSPDFNAEDLECTEGLDFDVNEEFVDFQNSDIKRVVEKVLNRF